MYGNFLKGVIKIGQERVCFVYERFRIIVGSSSSIVEDQAKTQKKKTNFMKNV